MGKRRISLLVSITLLLLIIMTACGSSDSGNEVEVPTPVESNEPENTVDGEPEQTPEMTALIEAAQKEGKVVYAVNATPERRNAMVKAFKDKYDIDLEILELAGGQLIARLDTEAQANQVSVDVFGGPFPIYEMAAKGNVMDMTGVLIDPEVLDPDKWIEGYPWLFEGGDGLPPEFKVGVYYGEQVVGQLFTNPDIIKEGDLVTWDDLLKPEFKGKIAGNDPRDAGIGYATAGAIIHIMGEEYFQKLYNGQEIKLARDARQLADWVVRGTYPILLGGNNTLIDEYMKQGLSIHMPTPTGGPDGLIGGSLAIMKAAPNPNAAKLFVNWMLTKEGQEIVERYQGGISGRTDTTTREHVIQFTIPTAEREKNTKLGKWFYDASPEFYYNYRETVYDKIPLLLDESILGPKEENK